MSRVVSTDSRTSEGYLTVGFTRDWLLNDPDFECVKTVDTLTGASTHFAGVR